MRHQFCGLLHFASAYLPIGKMATRQNRVAPLFSPRSSRDETPFRPALARSPKLARYRRGDQIGQSDIASTVAPNLAAIYISRQKQLADVEDVWRRWSGEREERSSQGVGEGELDGVEEMAGWAAAETAVFLRVAVERVANDGMSEMRGMDPDLVGAAGLDHELDEGETATLLKDGPTGDGAFAVRHIHSHSLWIPRLAADCRDELAGGGLGRTVEHSEISLSDVEVALEHLAQLQVGAAGLRKYYDSTRLGVETMDYARTLHAADRAHLGVEADEFCRESALLVSRRRMNVNAGRFVDGDDIIVIVDDFELHLTTPVCGPRLRRWSVRRQ